MTSRFWIRSKFRARASPSPRIEAAGPTEVWRKKPSVKQATPAAAATAQRGVERGIVIQSWREIRTRRRGPAEGWRASSRRARISAANREEGCARGKRPSAFHSAASSFQSGGREIMGSRDHRTCRLPCPTPHATRGFARRRFSRRIRSRPFSAGLIPHVFPLPNGEAAPTRLGNKAFRPFEWRFHPKRVKDLGEECLPRLA